MLKYMGKRLAGAIPNLAGVLIFTFIMARLLPGDPASFLAGPAASQHAVEEIRHNLGLDRSIAMQFVSYLGDVCRGDWGVSWSTGQSITSEIATRLPASLELTFFGMAIALLLALPMGILSALRPGTIIDHICRFVATAGVSLPTFFTGLLLLFVFYYLLGWAPSPMGRISAFALTPAHLTGFYLIDTLLSGDMETFLDALRQIALPGLTLAVFAIAPLARMTRASMLAVMSADFIRTARAANLPRLQIIVSYALRNALGPVLTTIGMVFSFTLGANVLVEKVFSWPGIGSFALEALLISDYAAVQGFVLSMGILYVVVNLLIDIAHLVSDPRLRIA